MNIDSIQNGYVIDHIHAGRSMEIYHYLGPVSYTHLTLPTNREV